MSDLSIVDQIESKAVDKLETAKKLAVLHWKLILVGFLVVIVLVCFMVYVPNPVSEGMFSSKLEKDIDRLIDEINDSQD